MKKLVAFALILSLGMFSVVGCGGTTTTKPSDKGAPAKGAPEKGAPATTPEKTK